MIVRSNKPETGTLYYGDCYDLMTRWIESGYSSESVDLIYLDPPFNSKANYNITFGKMKTNGKSAQLTAFEDTWSWDDRAVESFTDIKRSVNNPLHNAVMGLHLVLGDSGMLAYLIYMGERLVLMHKLLKPTGSIYLHCDPTASHYLKIVMDAVFGAKNFGNEIIWAYRTGGASTRNFAKKHDILLRYAKDKGTHTFNQPFEKSYMTGQLKHSKNKPVTLAPNGDTYQDILFSQTNIRVFKDRNYVEDKGFYTLAGMRDVWTDIDALGRTSKERTPYRTQKPLSLLDRIIKASTNEGDVVLDPFCGCGTTIEAAYLLNRKWIGIDVSPFAINLVQERRLKPKGVIAKTDGIPKDLESAKKLAKDDPFGFEKWAIHIIPGLAPNESQVNDGGIDGRGIINDGDSSTDDNGVLAQVKSGGFNLSQLRDFLHVIKRDKARLGVYITLEPITSSMAKSEVANLGKTKIGATEYPRVQLWSLKDYFEDRVVNLPTMFDPFTGKPMIIQQGMILTGDNIENYKP